MRQGGPIRPFVALLALALSFAPAAGAWASPAAPRLGVTSFEKLPQPLPQPFNPKANARKNVEAARKKAMREGKLLLIEMGGNWCISCRRFAGTLKLAPMKRFVDRHFVIVPVDVGRLDRNLDIPGRYDVDQLPGLPAVMVIDPRTDQLLNEGEMSVFAHLPRSSPQAIANWLAQWAD